MIYYKMYNLVINFFYCTKLFITFAVTDNAMMSIWVGD